jgi:hypothetical protein
MRIPLTPPTASPDSTSSGSEPGGAEIETEADKEIERARVLQMLVRGHMARKLADGDFDGG